MAQLTAVYGPMFAGKTTFLLQKIEEYQRLEKPCLVVKPKLDDRYGKEAAIQAHSGLKGTARLVDEKKPTEILQVWEEEGEKHKVIVIDEAMFFEPELLAVVRELLARELEVVVAGLDLNYRREPFGVMPRLIKLADQQIGLKARCYKCGDQAPYSARLAGRAGKIVVGASESYQPTCESCHTIYEDEVLKQIVFPWRVGANKEEGKSIRIEVMADSMRVGKTTAVSVIAEGLRQGGKTVTECYEDWQHNPFLKKSYSDPEKNFLESQKWFVKRKWEQVKEGGRGVYIQDVAPEMDYCYAVTSRLLGRMSEEHFSQYDMFYKNLDWEQAPAPKLLIYLKVSDRELVRRANETKREFEKVDSEYFLMMKKVNRAWLKWVRSRIGETKILEINTDHYDFAHEEKAKVDLVQQVMRHIELF